MSKPKRKSVGIPNAVTFSDDFSEMEKSQYLSIQTPDPEPIHINGPLYTPIKIPKIKKEEKETIFSKIDDLEKAFKYWELNEKLEDKKE